MYVLIYAHTQAYVCVHVYMYVRTYASLTHSGMYDARTCYASIYIYKGLCTYACVLHSSFFTRMHVCVCVCVFVCVDMTSVNQAPIRTYTFPDFPDEISCLSLLLFNKDICPKDTGLVLAQAVTLRSLIAESRIQNPRE
jgi:hypothetical protein